MKIEQINDLAYKYVAMNLLLTSGCIKKYFYENGGILEDLDYFLVFLKHWIDNKKDLEWSNILLEINRSPEPFVYSDFTIDM